jgi:hypothetical protein
MDNELQKERVLERIEKGEEVTERKAERDRQQDWSFEVINIELSNISISLSVANQNLDYDLPFHECPFWASLWPSALTIASLLDEKVICSHHH